MTIIVEMILMGALATLVMDLLAVRLAKMKVIHPPIRSEAVGRWILYMLRGKFSHRNINKTPTLDNEKSVALAAHYLIGIALAGIYLFLELKVPVISDQLSMPLLFGLATVLLPWLWLYPSMGLGFLGSKTPRQSPYIITSLVNHTNFGLGLVIWVVLFRRFLV